MTRYEGAVHIPGANSRPNTWKRTDRSTLERTTDAAKYTLASGAATAFLLTANTTDPDETIRLNTAIALQSSQSEFEPLLSTLSPHIEDEPTQRGREQIETEGLQDVTNMIIHSIPEEYFQYDRKAENRAAKRVLEFAPDIERIVSNYFRVSKVEALAILKRETQGRLGLHESTAGAIGGMQVTYEGGFQTVWKSMFSDDPFFKKFRFYNEKPIDGMKAYMNNVEVKPYILEFSDKTVIDNSLIVDPKELGLSEKEDIELAARKTFENLRSHLDREIPPGNYNLGHELGIFQLEYLRFKGEFSGPELYAAYNAGETAVRAHGGIPPFSETRNYVRDVLLFKEIFGTAEKSAYVPELLQQIEVEYQNQVRRESDAVIQQGIDEYTQYVALQK